MSWFSQKSQLKTDKSYYEEQSTKSIENIETQVLLNIQSIQKFYNLNSEKKLIEIILNEKESEALFNRKPLISSSISKNEELFKQQKQQRRIRHFSQKYTYQALIDKFPRPKSGTNELLLKILEIKLSKSVITSHQTRKSIWMLASGAKFNMINNKDLYASLSNYNDYPKYFQRAILQDLHRTVNKTTSSSTEEDIPKLKNVLIAFSRRNPFIGYCQGLNFIAYFLLTMQFTEEESFFLLSSMLESIIPMDYYTNMIGVVCDQQIFINMLKIIKPHIAQKFDQVGLDPSVLSIQWFVCLFTSSLPFYVNIFVKKLVKIVWDRLLVQGTRAFIKTGLIIVSYFQDAIMSANQFHEIIMILEKGTKNLKISETEFNNEFEKYFIDKKGLKIARNLYRQYHIKEKLSEKVNNTKVKIIPPKCNPKWPICIAKLQRMRRERQEIDIWVFRPQNPPKIIHDYLTNKPKNFQKKINITAASISGDKNRLIQSFRSINEDSSIIQSPQFMSKTAKKPNKPKQKQNYSEEKDQFSRTKKKYQNQGIPVPKNIQNKLNSEIILGRMTHICQKQTIEMERLKTTKKNQSKFLSMIIEESDDIKNDAKKAQTYKKIQKASQLFSDEENNEQQSQQKNSSTVDKNEGITKALSKHQRELLAQSRAVNFYNQFVENNKQLSSLIGGLDPSENQKKSSNQVKQGEQSQRTSQNQEQSQKFSQNKQSPHKDLQDDQYIQEVLAENQDET